MVFKLDRILPGIFIVLFFLFFYFINLDNFFFICLLIFIFYDFYYSKFISINKIFFYFSYFIFLFIVFYYFKISLYFLFFLTFISIFFSFFILKKNLFFFISGIFSYLIFVFFLLEFDRDLFFLIVLLSFINDTSAYILGNFFKGPPIIKQISPNKTWSGTSFSFIISFLILAFFDYNFLDAILIALSFFLGDIYFSFVKRQMNIKDFSNLLSGHGGVLDRIDSLYLSSFLIYISHII